MMKSMQSFVERGDVPGYVAIIDHRGHTQIEAAGTRTLNGERLEPDAIFRITSMTKPITAAVTLRLVEQDKLTLSAPIEKWLPELENRRVLKRPDSPLTDTVPLKRSVTVEDLLSFRIAYYLLGILLSRVTQKALDQLFQEEVFDPLGMVDTGFTVPEEKVGRLTDCYWFDSENQKLELCDSADQSLWRSTPPFLDAAAGLVSTAHDYLAFAKMLLHGGMHEGRAFLAPELMKAMTSNQLTPAQRSKPTFSADQWENHGYGYGVSVLISESKRTFGKSGQYGWDGGFGSTW